MACGTSTAPVGPSGTQPALLSRGQVEAQTRGHPTVLLFTAQGCASCEADARALQDAARGRSDVRLVGIDITGSDTAQSLVGYVQAMGPPIFGAAVQGGRHPNVRCRWRASGTPLCTWASYV